MGDVHGTAEQVFVLLDIDFERWNDFVWIHDVFCPIFSSQEQSGR